MFKRIVVSVLLLIAATVAVAQTLPPMRMTPAEIRSSDPDNSHVGGSGVVGFHTQVICGDPTKAGFYSALLFVPAHTIIQAHSHRDNRMATVVSGEWHFGYGDHFDAKALKTLPPGSVYSEPGGQTHFAQTIASAVVVEVSGYGPTDTHYFDPANEPKPPVKK
jgi:hypothetical protein